MNHVHDVTTTGSALGTLAGMGGGGLIGMNGINSMLPLGGLVPTSAGLPTTGMMGDNKLVDMLEIPGKGRCYVYFARYNNLLTIDRVYSLHVHIYCRHMNQKNST